MSGYRDGLFMKRCIFALFTLVLSASVCSAEVIEFTFLETVECDGVLSSQIDFQLPATMSLYVGELSVETLGAMSVFNDSGQTIFYNYSSHLTARAKLLTRWAFDDLATVDDYKHFTGSLAAGEEVSSNISRNITSRGQVVDLTSGGHTNFGGAGRIQIDGECYQWFASPDGVHDSQHTIVQIKLRLFYRP